MIRKLISIVCFVLAVSACGCREQVSSNPAVEMKHSSLEATQTNEEIKIINTATPLDKNGPTVIAYYFHRTIRCPGCLEIEAAAQRVIETSFANQITDEKLTWIPFNLDDPGGRDFEREFDVSVSTLVLSKTEDGNHTKYKKLEKVWDFIGDPVKFDDYVQTEVRQFLNE
jgi:hypothetical protein